MPSIELLAKKASRDNDTQNELIQATILKCYEYELKVKQMHAEKRLNGWLWVVIKNHNIELGKGQPMSLFKDVADVVYTDRLGELEPFLSDVEWKWLQAYIKCDGRYSNIQSKLKISRRHASERIKSIIEKCKKLKSIV